MLFMQFSQHKALSTRQYTLSHVWASCHKSMASISFHVRQRASPYRLPPAWPCAPTPGNLKDLARLPQLSGRIPRTVSNIADRGGGNLAEYDPCIDAKKSKDATLVRAKVLEGLPHALLVGAGHPHAAQLKDDLGRVILHMEST